VGFEDHLINKITAGVSTMQTVNSDFFKAEMKDNNFIKKYVQDHIVPGYYVMQFIFYYGTYFSF